MTTYVVLYPHSVTNRTGRHRVVDFAEWEAYAYEGGPEPEGPEYNTFREAVRERDRLNRPQAQPVTDPVTVSPASSALFSHAGV